MNFNLFEAIELEKNLIFLILLILVVAAGFTISAYFFIYSFQKTREMAILKTMGISQFKLYQIFLIKSFLLSSFAFLTGFGLAYLGGLALNHLQNFWPILDQKVYGIDKVLLFMSLSSSLKITFACYFVSMVASYIPAKRAWKLSIKEALSYE